MFSKNKAPAWMLAVPGILIVLTIILAVLVVMNLNKPVQTLSSTPQQQTPEASTNNEQNNPQPQNSEDKFAKALSAIPESGFPANQCPEGLTEESNGNKFALDKDKKYTISAETKTWIEANCPDVEKLTF